MNIGITTFGSDGGRSGIGRYTVNLLQQLPQLENQTEYDLYAYKDEQTVFAPDSDRVNPRLVSERLRSPVMNIAWHQTYLPGWCRRLKHDVLFLPAGNRRLPTYVPCPTVGTIHDFSSLHVANKYDSRRMFYIKHVLPFLARRLTHVLTVSESSKRDIVEYARVPPERVTVTPLAVDHRRYRRNREMAERRIQTNLQLTDPYFLYVSRIEHPGKNHIRLIEAFDQLKQKEGIPHQLVFAGSDWTGAEIVHEKASQSRFSEQIKFTGFVPDEDLLDLYACAELLVFPSLYEGFGLPILEAMASGIPVACAATSSIPEVAGDAANYFDPHDTDEMVDAIRKLIVEPEFRNQCIERGRKRCKRFTWKATAQKTLDVLRSVA